MAVLQVNRVSSVIRKHLTAIRRHPGVTLLSIAHASGVPLTTVFRVLNAKESNMQYATACKLADYIEIETGGKVSADFLLSSESKDFHGADLRNADLSGKDLSGADLSFADLRGANLAKTNLTDAQLACAKLQDANLEGVSGNHADLRGAEMQGVNLAKASIFRWDMKGVNLSQSIIHDVDFDKPWIVGADLTGSSLKNTNFNINGNRCRGVALPEFEPEEISGAHNSHEVVAYFFLWEYPEDLEMIQIAEMMRSRLFFGCWASAAARFRDCYEHRMDDIISLLKKYDEKCGIYKRYQIGKQMLECKSLDDWECLNGSPHYSEFKKTIDRWIRYARRAYSNGDQDRLFEMYNPRTGVYNLSG